MKFRIKNIKIATGTILIALLNKIDAHTLDLYTSDRVHIIQGRKSVIATVDITDSSEIVPIGRIGLFKEVTDKLALREGEEVEIHPEKKPISLKYIKNKLQGKHLTSNEIKTIIKDITNDVLSDIEITYFVSACYQHELNIQEIVALTNAMVESGERLKFRKKVVVDKHCIGGVAGNRTTMLAVPILAANGLTVPKTSSRSITSAAGTSDTMEVLCDVSFKPQQLKSIVHKVGACIAWGGAVDLAPADDKIIRVEHPISLDPVGQLLASILAKKKSVSATHVLIDIPVGKGAKIEKREPALSLKRKFEILGKHLGMKVVVKISDGSQPIGNGIGPALEARDVLWTLMNSEHGCPDLREKTLSFCGLLLEMTGKAKKGQGYAMAKKTLESGKAYKKFIEIIRAQGGKKTKPEQIRIGKLFYDVIAQKSGKIRHIDNRAMNRVARAAGAPQDKEAGVYLFVHKYYKVKKGDHLLRIYSDNKERLNDAIEMYKTSDGIIIK